MQQGGECDYIIVGAGSAGASYHPTSTRMMGSHERTIVDSALRALMASWG